MSKKPTPMSGPDLLAAVEIDPLQLNNEFVRIPSLFARYSEMYAEALREHLTAKNALGRVHAGCVLKHKLAAAENGEKVTEAVIKARVESDTTYRIAQDRAVSAEIEKVRLGGALESLRKKSDALISLGAHVRAELKGAPLIRDHGDGHLTTAFDEEELDVELD